MCNQCIKVIKALCKIERVRLFPYQNDIIKTQSSIVLLGGRQIGKSFIISMKALAFALVHANTTTLIISPSLRQSLNLMRYVQEHINKCKLSKYIRNMNKVEINFINGSRMISLPSSPNTIRGYTCHLVVVDEANFIDEDLITNVLMPTISTTRGIMWLISTPFIKDHIFYKLYKNPPQGWETFTIPSSMNPLIPKEFLEEQKRILGSIYDQEYECTYIDDDQGIIPPKMIEAIIHPHPHPRDANLLLIDIGGKGTHGDAMGVVVCYRDDAMLHIIESYELHGDYLNNIDNLMDKYKGCDVIIDASGVGSGVFEYIQKYKNRGNDNKVFGVVWTKEKEFKALTNLMRAIKERNIIIHNKQACNDRLITQLKTCIFKHGKITTKDGKDDLLYSLLLAYSNDVTMNQLIYLAW